MVVPVIFAPGVGMKVNMRCTIMCVAMDMEMMTLCDTSKHPDADGDE